MVVHPKIEIIEDKQEGKFEISSSVLTFKFQYHGCVSADRRYSPTLFPWLAHSIIKQKNIKNVDIQISQHDLSIIDLTDDSILLQKYSLNYIYRLSRLKHCRLTNFFAFVSLGQNGNAPAKFHLLSSESETKKGEFLKTLKAKVLEFQKSSSTGENGTSLSPPPMKPTHRRGVSSGAILMSPSTTESIFRDSVYYIGRVTISQPQAPPHFIDEVLMQFEKLNSPRYNLLKSRRASSAVLGNKNYSFDDIADHNVNKSTENLFGEVSEISFRKRSASCSSDGYDRINHIKLPEKDEDITLNNVQDDVNSRLVTFQISSTSLMLFSVGTKMLLLEKKINNISFCTKAEVRSNHFGFICKEGGNHVCYIFQGESVVKVDQIMKAMKEAFTEALESSAHITLCDSCPLQFLHKLCTKLEDGKSNFEKKNILEEGMKYFTEYEQLHIMNMVNEGAIDELDQIEVTVNSMRGIIDDKQKSHKHTHKIQGFLGENDHRDRSKSSTIFEKARKSFTNSIQSFAQKKPPNGRSGFFQSHSTEGFTKPRSRSVNSTSSCPVTPDFSTNRATFAFNSDNVVVDKSTESNEKAADFNHAQNDDDDEKVKTTPKAREKLTRKTSWRQAIYHSVVAPRRNSTTSIATINESNIKVDPSERAKSRWKSAIMSQIVLIRMEKENKKLAANISATETRRQKLSYQELATYSADAAKTWDTVLKYKSNEHVDDRTIQQAIRGGIPKARRGEIWQFLIKQNVLRIPDITSHQEWKKEPYKSILKQNTSHQHSILIDLGRTFPTHAHFIPRLGSGQLGLFNILKAYSLLDDEVGYCQGLSFVAGMFLMHLSEEEAFKSFCHVMFDLDIRKQYKPDMNAVQQQMYQLSRLLHDFHPVLYEHFNKHDVTPTLYAAPWFLTLYASQYPVGFVARVMDLVLVEGLEIIFKVAIVLIGKHINEILECDSFESIVDYMKLSLPEKVYNETDEICTKALDMDIRQKLNLYEVEYQLLKEEMIDIKQSKEKMEKQEREHKQLVEEVKQKTDELEKANSRIVNLSAELELVTQERDDYKREIKKLKAERDMLNLTLSKQTREKSNSLISSSSDKSEKRDWDLFSHSDISNDSTIFGEDKISGNCQTNSDAIDSYEITKIEDVISIKSSSSTESEEVIFHSKTKNI